MPIVPPFFEPGDAPFEHVFSGTYFQTIDKYHRMSLPKEVRRMISENHTFIFWRSSYVNAIEVTTEEIFINTVQKKLLSYDSEKEKFHQTAEIYANVYKIFDRDGRFTIPTPLRIGIHFDRKIVIVGMGAFFHIWPFVEYERFYQQRSSDERADAERADGVRRAM